MNKIHELFFRLAVLVRIVERVAVRLVLEPPPHRPAQTPDKATGTAQERTKFDQMPESERESFAFLAIKT